jgi:hypothetical protein
VKTALIPPIPDLHKFGTGSFHLLLSHLFKSQEYREHYKKMRANGAWLVLDNSAHENGAGEMSEVLLKQALYYNAQEIVVPDVLDDGESTIETGREALDAWFPRTGTSPLDGLNPQLMYVPQGKDYADWKECLRNLIGMHKYVAKKNNVRANFTIGISKDYEVWDGGIARLIRDDVEPIVRGNQQGVQVHLLGWGRQLWCLRGIAKEFPWIRSTDSAKPFVYAWKGIELDSMQDPPPYPTRPPGYFFRKLTKKQIEIASSNVHTFTRTAQGRM